KSAPENFPHRRLWEHRMQPGERRKSERLSFQQKFWNVFDQAIDLVGFGAVIHPTDSTFAIDQKKGSAVQEASRFHLVRHSGGEVACLTYFEDFFLIPC